MLFTENPLYTNRTGSDLDYIGTSKGRSGTLSQFDITQKPKKRTKLNIIPGKSFEGTDMGNYVWLTLNQDLQEFKAVIQVIQLQENQHLKQVRTYQKEAKIIPRIKFSEQYFRQMQALAQQQSYAQRFGGFGPGFFQGPEDFGGNSDPNVNEGFIRTPGNDENVGAFATANITPQGGHGTVGVLPGLATRFSSDDGGSPPPNGNSFGVFTSSSSGSSDVNGKKTSYKTATSAINDNGKITVYNALIPHYSWDTSSPATKRLALIPHYSWDKSSPASKRLALIPHYSWDKSSPASKRRRITVPCWLTDYQFYWKDIKRPGRAVFSTILLQLVYRWPSNFDSLITASRTEF
uniref:Uncharacterized protein n=1 Tax=Timema poppense TaxID=170557 RepID=A0A7R9D1D8_TIMPO|nr:unnamed protein product [Timema poppensis]